MDEEKREREREIAYTKAKRRRGSRVFQVGKPRGGFGTFAARVSHSRERKGSILFNREDLPCLEEARPKSAIPIDANYRLIACHRCDLSSFKWHSENLPRLLALLFGNTLTSVVSVTPIPTLECCSDYYQSFSVLLLFDQAETKQSAADTTGKTELESQLSVSKERSDSLVDLISRMI